MPIDTDVQSFTEENANISDCNTKINQLSVLVLNDSLTSADNNKLLVRRSGVWSLEGEEAYNGNYQDFGNISESVILNMNGNSCRTAMVATVVGDTFVTGFGDNFSSGVVYTLFIKQDSVGGFTVRWPYGASVLNQVGTDPDQITEVYLLKLPSGKIFIKCSAFQNTVTVGSVIKEFETPAISYPETSQIPSTFIWTKNPAVSYGGILTGLYSDWEISDDELYFNLLFSSYGNTTDLTSIQVILSQSGTVYMRTRYGGNISGTPVISDWDETVCQIGTSESYGERYWDQVVFCLNANTYNVENSPKKVDSKGYFVIKNHGMVRPVFSSQKLAFRFNGVNDLLTCDDSFIFRPTTEDFTFEMFFSVDNPTNGSSQFMFIKSTSTGYASFVMSIGTNGKLGAGFYTASLSSFSLYSLNSLNANQVYHAAIVRSGSSFKLFLDGILQQEHIQSVTLYSNTSDPMCFGTTTDYLYRFTGYIYSVRITKNIARYDSNFIVSLSDPYFKTGNLWWTPEPKYISNEKFSDYNNWDKVECLINGYGVADSTSIIDETGKAITIGGNTKIDVTSNLSSIIFDGNGDYMYVGNRGDFNFLHNGTCNWTVDFWFNPSAVSDDGIFDTCEGSSSNYGTSLYFQAGTGKFVLTIMRSSGSPSSAYMNGVFNYVFSAGTLYHVAITLDWSLSTDNAKLYVNGTLQSTLTQTGFPPSPNRSKTALMVGGFGAAYPTYMFNGKMYSFRISSYLRYTSNFTVDSTRPYFIPKPKIENWAETSLVVNAYNLPINSTDIRDAKGNAISVFGDTKILVDSNGLKYINFDGTGDYLSTPQNVDLYSFGTSDFTMEVIFSVASLGAERGLIAAYSSWSGTLAFYLVVNSSGTIRFYAGNSIPVNVVTTTTVVINTLYHVAVSRVSGVTSIYINGINSASTSSVATITNTSEVRIGTSFGGEIFNGKIYSCRITKGKALYTSNFNVDLTNPYFPAIDSISDLWIDANDFAKMTMVTGVSKIVDKSGSMREAIQGSTTNQPALLQNAQNGLMALNFDGTDDYLSLGTVLGKPSNWDLFVVGKFDVISGSRTIISSGDNSGNIINSSVVLGIFTGYANKLFYQFGNGSVGSYGYTIDDAITDAALFEQHYTSGNNFTDIFVNCVNKSLTKVSTSATSCGGTPYEWTIGKLGAYNGNFLDGFVSECFYSSKVLSTHVYNLIRGFLAYKWGLVPSLPANHPYKSSYPMEDFRPDYYWYCTVLCLNGVDVVQSSRIVDSSKNNKITVYGDTKALIDANNKQYINFDGTGDYLTIVKNTNSFSFLTEDFTIEFFADITSYSTSTTYSTVLLDNLSGAANYQIFIDFSGDLKIYTPSGGVNSAGVSVTTGSIHHYAIVRNGNNIYFYKDGVLGSSASFSSTLSNTGDLSLFYGSSIATNLKLYSLRVTKGLSRYTSNFISDTSYPYFPKLQNKQGIISILKPDAWFDADDSATITVEGTGRISQWADKSGNNYHALMSVDANRPVLSASTINGKDALYFDGLSRFLTLGTVLGKPSNFTVFVVGVFHDQSSKTNMCGSGNSVGSSVTYWGDIGVGRTSNDGKVEYSVGDGSNYAYGRTTNAIIVTDEWFYGGWVYTGGNKPIWYHKGIEKAVTYEAGTATSNGGTAYSFSLGKCGEYAGHYLNGKIAEVLIFRRGLSYNEMLLVSEYLENKWFK